MLATLYVIGLAAILVAAWRQAAACDRAEGELARRQHEWATKKRPTR